MVFRNLDEPKPENIDQLQLYLHYFKVPKGILLYVSKDNQDLKEFVVSYDRKRAKQLLDDLEDLNKKIKANVIPVRIPAYPNDWQCKYCQFRAICDAANGGEVDWEDFKSKIESQKPV